MSQSRFITVLSSMLLVSSCTTYRLQYEEQFRLSRQHSQVKESYGPYHYLYEESYSRYWYPFACGLTFSYLGGLCWMYFWTNPFDAADLKERAQQKRDQLIGPGLTLTQLGDYEIHNFRATNADQPARIRVFDPEQKTILRGQAESITSLPPGFWTERKSAHAPVIILSQSEASEPIDDQYSFAAIQLSLLQGQASVRSTVSENGRNSTVAAGEVENDIYELRSRVLPVNGWFWSFTPSYRQQRLKIADFDSNLPLFESWDKEEIPVVISNPNTQEILPSFTNSYRVSLQSYGLYVGGGYSQHYKLKNSSSFWSWSGAAWVSTIDYMLTEVQFQSRTVKARDWEAFKNYRFDMDLYYNILPARLAIGLHWQYAFYPSVKMPDQMEFRGPARYEAGKDIFERPRLFVNDLDFDSQAIGISLSYIYKDDSIK